jgi:hypothetical protein
MVMWPTELSGQPGWGRQPCSFKPRTDRLGFKVVVGGSAGINGVVSSVVAHSGGGAGMSAVGGRLLSMQRLFSSRIVGQLPMRTKVNEFAAGRTFFYSWKQNHQL